MIMIYVDKLCIILWGKLFLPNDVCYKVRPPKKLVT